MHGSKLLIISSLIACCLVIFVSLYIRKLEKKVSYANQIASLNQQGSVVQLAGKIVPVTNTDHIKGNKNANITIIEYSDFQCTECQTVQPTIDKIVKDYGDKVRFVTRAMPLPQHPDAIIEAEATECAGELGGENTFWIYSRAIYDKSTKISTGIGFPLAKLVPLAKELGMDEKKFTNCLQSGKYAKKINTEKIEGNNIGIQQLPSMIVIDSQNNTQLIVGAQPYDVYKIVLGMDLL